MGLFSSTFLSLHTFIPLTTLAILPFLLPIPSFVFQVVKLHNRLQKDLVRLSLGLGLGVALSLLLLLPLWWEKTIVLFCILLTYHAFKLVRSRSTPTDTVVCPSCARLDKATACPTYLQVYEAETQYSREVSDHLQSQMTWGDVQKRFGLTDKS